LVYIDGYGVDVSNADAIEYYSLSPFYSNANSATQVRLNANDLNFY
jgi:hypothetical protein